MVNAYQHKGKRSDIVRHFRKPIINTNFSSYTTCNIHTGNMKKTLAMHIG